MKVANLNVPSWVVYSIAVGVAIYVIKKGGLPNAVAGAAASVVELVAAVPKGVVLGTGDVIGLPRVEIDLCKKSISAGDNFGASKYCSAGVFAKWQYLSGKKRLTGQSFTMQDIFN